MSMKLKMTVAAIALAITGTANAAITGTISNDPGMNGSGELFINIVRDTASPATIVLDTNINANDLVSGAVTSWTSNAAQTAAVASLFSTSANLSDFVFDAGAVQNNGSNLDQFGLFLTNTNTTLVPPPVVKINNFSNFITSARQWTVSVNQGPNAGPDGMLTPATSGFGDWTDGIRGWNGNGNVLQWTPTTSIGVTNSLDLYRYFYQPDGTPVNQLFGKLNIDVATGQVSFGAASVSAVPVPAAVWLFGSGLMGMVGVARRRKV